MRVADLSTVVAIERQVFTSPWSAQAFLFDLTRRREAHYLVARYLPWAADDQPSGKPGPPCDPSIMGYAGAWFVVDEVHIATLAVRPEWRGRGIGELLFVGLLRWAIAQGADFATLEVRVSNTIAQRLYTKYGLELVGRRRRYYADNREDALLMTAEQLSSPTYAELLDANERALLARLNQSLATPPELQPLCAVAPHT
jgi:ribosomal-protein-alanine N-acetyltransferase